MNSSDSMEARLKALGTTLRERPSLAVRITQEARQIRDFRTVVNGTPGMGRPARRRRWSWLVSGAAVLSVAAVIGLFLAPSSSVGWAEMSKAMRAQRWIRARSTYLDGKHVELWVSPVQKLWAMKSDEQLLFGDEKQQARYEFDRRRGEIVKMALGDESVARMLPLDDLTGDDATVHPWMFGTEKITSQKRRELTDGGRRWIEFDLVFWRGEMNRGTLRIDSRSSLPVYLFTYGADPAKTMKWEFDYPDQGPSDVYDLGVARDVAVNDRMPSSEAQRVLDAMAASRARIGDFRLVMFQPDPGPVRSLSGAMIVWRKGERWRVDLSPPVSGPVGQLELDTRQSRDDWLSAQLRSTSALYVCDGRTVYENSGRSSSGMITGRSGPGMVKWQPARAAPQDLASGERSAGSLSSHLQFVQKVYPNLTVPHGWTFEFDPRPADGDGCVLIRISAVIAGGRQRAHEWYYIDPARGHAVIRAELFNLPVDTMPERLPDDRQTIRVEGFRQAPSGFWHPTSVRETTPSRPATINGDARLMAGHETTIQYRFDFDAEMPESLFDVEKSEP